MDGKIKKKFNVGEGYLQISQDNLSESNLVSHTIYHCVICGREANIIAPETNEILCRDCMRNNDEARLKK